jgi:hypothetical protein
MCGWYIYIYALCSKKYNNVKCSFERRRRTHHWIFCCVGANSTQYNNVNLCGLPKWSTRRAHLRTKMPLCTQPATLKSNIQTFLTPLSAKNKYVCSYGPHQSRCSDQKIALSALITSSIDPRLINTDTVCFLGVIKSLGVA